MYGIGYEPLCFQIESYLDRLRTCENLIRVVFDFNRIQSESDRLRIDLHLRGVSFAIELLLNHIRLQMDSHRSWYESDRVRVESKLDTIRFGPRTNRIGYDSHRFQIGSYLDVIVMGFPYRIPRADIRRRGRIPLWGKG